jgi:hypothetical protein
VTVGDPATSSTIAMITEAVKLATQTLFRFIVLFSFNGLIFFVDSLFGARIAGGPRKT